MSRDKSESTYMTMVRMAQVPEAGGGGVGGGGGRVAREFAARAMVLLSTGTVLLGGQVTSELPSCRLGTQGREG